MGDPNTVPEIVGSLLSGPQNKAPPNFRKLTYDNKQCPAHARDEEETEQPEGGYLNPPI